MVLMMKNFTSFSLNFNKNTTLSSALVTLVKVRFDIDLQLLCNQPASYYLGFFSKGHRLGTNVSHNLPPHRAREQAVAAAEKRRKISQTLGGSRRLGGHPNSDRALTPRELAARVSFIGVLTHFALTNIHRLPSVVCSMKSPVTQETSLSAKQKKRQWNRRESKM